MEAWLAAIGCPYCQGALHSAADKVGLTCSGCGQTFALRGRTPVFLRAEDVERLARFADEYRQARLRDGWRPLTQEQALALPYGQPPGYQPLYWQVRRQSFCALMRLLAREGPSPAAGPVADLGAGFGWLTYRLAQVGYRVVAVEASTDDIMGLGAAEAQYAPHADFCPVLGDLDHAPLQAGRFALVILNASLHYAQDLDGAVQRCARALGTGGRLVVLDTPIARRPRPGTHPGDRHLGQQELHDALLGAGLHPRWIAVGRDLRWWRHQVRAWLSRNPRFSFPMVVAERRQ
jgi:SAM-dependent methyltransferase